MVSLTDISPVGKPMPIDATQSVDCFGVSAAGIAMLIGRFPEISDLLMGQAPKDITLARILEVAPGAVAVIIAAGTGAPGDAKAEEVASSFPLELQYNLLEAIVDLTMPSGIGPFIDRLTQTVIVANGFVAGMQGAALATKSQSQSNASSQPATTQ